MPRNIEEVMALPDDFGIPEKDRNEVTVNQMDDVIRVSEQVQKFCTERGIDQRRAMYAGLAMEEMARNVISHGFTKDRKKHTVELCTAVKDGHIILRVIDDCIPFNPKERSELVSPEDPLKNIGIRMIYRILHDISYQYMLGMNVLTIRI